MSKAVNIDIDDLNDIINKLKNTVENSGSEHLTKSEPEASPINTSTNEPRAVTNTDPIIKKDKRGRKPKYATDEERHQAAIIHQREYRKRKKQQFEDMRNQINELTALLEQSNSK